MGISIYKSVYIYHPHISVGLKIGKKYLFLVANGGLGSKFDTHGNFRWKNLKLGWKTQLGKKAVNCGNV